MTPTFVSDCGRVTLFNADCLNFQPTGYDCVITDPPFSDKTHDGHFAATNGNGVMGYDGSTRKDLGYDSWGESEVRDFCVAYTPPGWMVVLTDHVLAPFWAKYQPSRYVFAPLPSFTPGRSVRLSGDGPSSWTNWIIVSRTAKQVKWGTLPGGYINARGDRGHMGGKPIGLMIALAEDYSQEGDTVCDPCMGQGTTGIACLRTNRRFIGVERDHETFSLAVNRIKRELAQGTLKL